MRNPVYPFSVVTKVARMQQGLVSFRTHGLTLIELIATMTVLTILMALLLPLMHGIRERSDQTMCVANLRQMHALTIMYINDHDGTFPGPLAARVPRGDTGNEFLPYYFNAYLPPNFANAGSFAGIHTVLEGTKLYTCPAHWHNKAFQDLGSIWGKPAVGQASYGVSVTNVSAEEIANGLSHPVWGNVNNATPPMKMVNIPDTLRSRIWLIQDTDDDWILWESGLHFHRNGRNVLWLDGHVEWITSDRENPGAQTLTRPY